MSFAQIKGQDEALNVLRSVLQNRPTHSYLFCGPEGVGKKMTALAAAQFLNCPFAGDDACGQCPSCRKIALGEHADVILLEPDGASIKIEQVRSLSSLTALRSFEGGYQVIILNEAHLLTEQAANSLLKILEEPKEKTVFILITSKPEAILSTIRSRCTVINFKGLSATVIVEILGGQAAQAALLANGSVKTAQDILNDPEFFTLRQEVHAFITRLPSLSNAQTVEQCELWKPNKAKAIRILSFVEFWFRDLLIYRLSQNAELLLNKDCLESYQSFTADLDLLSILEKIEQAMSYLRQNVSPQLTLAVCFFKISPLNNFS